MEEIRAIALAYYDNGSRKMKQIANNFFGSMDENGDGKISLAEYLAFLKKKQDVVDQRMCSRDFFNYLKKDESKDHMSHADVLTLYYIIVSDRRFCGACGVFLCGLYFTCVECFPREKNRYSVCFQCYRDKIFVHHHSGPLVDNYTLPIAMNGRNLDKSKTSERTTKTSASSSRGRGSASSSMAIIVPASSSRGLGSALSSMAIVPASSSRGQGSASSSLAIVPASSSRGRGSASKMANIALKAVELAAAIGIAIANCSIM